MSAPIDTRSPLALVRPSVELHQSWLGAADEFSSLGEYQHGSGLTPDGDEPREGQPAWRASDLIDPERFTEFVAWVAALTDPGFARALGMVADTKLWIIRDATFLGSVSLRHELNDFLFEQGGHIGYSVRPSARRRGIATEALRQTLEVAHGLGLDRVLLTCDDGNLGSARTIENCGGRFEDVRGDKRRYWISLPRI
jgi:predicted acetyltransferase